MTSNSRWTSDECENLYDNYLYYLKGHKEDAVKEFSRTWRAIEAKAQEIGIAIYKTKNCQAILSSLKPYIDGLMLSDGNMVVENLSAGYYRQNCHYRDWLVDISNKLTSFGMEVVLDDLPTLKSSVYKGRLIEGSVFNLRTHNYIEFRDMWKRWYDNRFKIIPKDIELTPECVANWFYGDGCTSKKSGLLSISTKGFIEEDVDFICEKLNYILDSSFHVDKSNSVMTYKLKNIKIFFDYIKEYNPSCYSYKIPKELINNGS